MYFEDGKQILSVPKFLTASDSVCRHAVCGGFPVVPDRVEQRLDRMGYLGYKSRIPLKLVSP
jgi:hypothetical protein